MSPSSTFISAVLFAALTLASVASAVPGDFTDAQVRKQKCSKGCVAGLLVMAGIIGIICSAIMCFAVWPAAELASRQENRVAARKRIRERREAEEEARAKNEALNDGE